MAKKTAADRRTTDASKPTSTNASKTHKKTASASPAAGSSVARPSHPASSRLSHKARNNKTLIIQKASELNPDLNVHSFQPKKPVSSSTTNHVPLHVSKKTKKRQRAVIAALKKLPPIPTPLNAVADGDGDDGVDDQERELTELVFGADMDGIVSRTLSRAFASNETDTNRSVDRDIDTERHEDNEAGHDDVLGFSIDTGDANGSAEDPTTEMDQTVDMESSAQQDEPIGKAAWADEDDNQDDDAEKNPEFMVDIRKTKRLRKLRQDFDEHIVSGVEYERRLRAQYERMFPTPKWAELPESAQKEDRHEDDQDDDDCVAPRDGTGADQTTRSTSDELGHDALVRLLQTTQKIAVEDRAKMFSADRFVAMRLKDANQTAPSQAVVQSIAFHPTAPVLLTSGFDKTLRLFHIDGRINHKIESVYIKDTPIFTAQFTADGKQVVVCGRRKWYYVHDLVRGETTKVWDARSRAVQTKSYESLLVSPCGRYLAFLCRDGCIAIVNAVTKQWSFDLKLNGTVTSAAFSGDGDTLYSIGSEGDVYVWDVPSRSCVHRFRDDGCVKATSIAVSVDATYIAVGSSSGVVNVYHMQDAMSSTSPRPARSLMHLTTPITTIVFDPLTRCMVMASRSMRDALRVVHLPSLNVFPNWPTSTTPLGYVSDVVFDPKGNHLAIANAKGRVLLYRI